MIPEQMSGVVLTGHGGFDKLEWRDSLPIPELTANDVLIKVAAAGVNNTDLNTRLAWYSKSESSAEDATWSGVPLTFPRVQGIDACGHIVKVGSAVDDQRIGERVIVEPCLREFESQPLPTAWFLGSECDGSFAQYVKVADRHAYRIGSDFSDVELASFPCSYSTAENMLTRSEVGVNDTVFITGASGGVGSAAVQLAKARGASVIVQCSSEKSQALLEIGADKAIGRDANLLSEIGANQADCVIDLVAGANWPQYLDIMKPFGRYAVSGAIAGPLVELDVRTLYLKDLSFFGCTVLGDKVFSNLVQRIENRDIEPLVAKQFPLRDIVAAQKAFEEKNYVGKIVLSVGE